MSRFSEKSLARLATCDPHLQEICHEAIEIFDFTVLCGHRGGDDQARLFEQGRTKLKFPFSKHNKFPSQAIDIVPYPIDWDDDGRFCVLAGIMFGIAASKGIKLRWGHDWNQNWQLHDQKFIDAPHFEL